MKKIVIIIICLIVIIISSSIGYLAVSANTEVAKEENIIDIQNELQENFKSYGYTLNNPNIIINPYEISPLTALIIFETEKETEVSITVEGKTPETTYKNTFKKSKIHYIPVYGLYPDHKNKVILKCNNQEKKIEIQTNKLPGNFKNNEQNTQNNPIFISDNNIIYALDQNNDIRWYLTKNYTKKISRLSNGNFLLSNDKKNQNGYNTGLLEIDLFGKIYKEYQIKDGYYGSYVELDKTLLILSKDLLEIDKQTGEIIDKINLSDKYNKISYKNNIITLNSKEKNIIINKNTKEQKEINIQAEEIKNNEPVDFYIENKHYKIETGISFYAKQETPVSSKEMFLINYKKPDKKYQEYNIKLKKERDRLVISGEFDKKDKVYIILEKFMEKRVYDLKVKENKTYKYINDTGITGKYSIYIKINNELYKTNNYVKF